MNESTTHRTDDPDPGIHDATKALQDLADEVERERVERGRSAIDPVKLSDGVDLADEIAHSDGTPANLTAGQPTTADPTATNPGSTDPAAVGTPDDPLEALPTVPPRMQLPH